MVAYRVQSNQTKSNLFKCCSYMLAWIQLLDLQSWMAKLKCLKLKVNKNQESARSSLSGKHLPGEDLPAERDQWLSWASHSAGSIYSFPFLDAIASPSSYSCQWVSKWVGQWVSEWLIVSDLEIQWVSFLLLCLMATFHRFFDFNDV